MLAVCSGISTVLYWRAASFTIRRTTRSKEAAWQARLKFTSQSAGFSHRPASGGVRSNGNQQYPGYSTRTYNQRTISFSSGNRDPGEKAEELIRKFGDLPD